MKSIENICKKVTYIHRSSIARHIGDSNSFHNWCKNKLLPDATSSHSTPSANEKPSTSLPGDQKSSVDAMIINNSFYYYKVLFRLMLFMVEEEMPFTKMPKLVKLEQGSGLKLSMIN